MKKILFLFTFCSCFFHQAFARDISIKAHGEDTYNVQGDTLFGTSSSGKVLLTVDAEELELTNTLKNNFTINVQDKKTIHVEGSTVFGKVDQTLKAGVSRNFSLFGKASLSALVIKPNELEKLFAEHLDDFQKIIQNVTAEYVHDNQPVELKQSVSDYVCNVAKGIATCTFDLTLSVSLSN